MDWSFLSTKLFVTTISFTISLLQFENSFFIMFFSYLLLNLNCNRDFNQCDYNIKYIYSLETIYVDS